MTKEMKKILESPDDCQIKIEEILEKGGPIIEGDILDINLYLSGIHTEYYKLLTKHEKLEEKLEKIKEVLEDE